MAGPRTDTTHDSADLAGRPMGGFVQPRGDESIHAGSSVEVRRRFDRAWARGFEVVRITDMGVLLRRLSDGVVLPVAFALDDVRLAVTTPSLHRRMRRTA